jgi:hypothetical protein
MKASIHPKLHKIIDDDNTRDVIKKDINVCAYKLKQRHKT